MQTTKSVRDAALRTHHLSDLLAQLRRLVRAHGRAHLQLPVVAGRLEGGGARRRSAQQRCGA
jgi:hypothetical protein